MILFDDDNYDIKNIGYLRNVESLDKTKKHTKLINDFISETGLSYASFKSLDYESVNHLINEAKELNSKLISIPEKLIEFISRCNTEVGKRILIDFNYDKDISLLVSNFDSKCFHYFIRKYRDLFSFSDEEIILARRKYIEDVFSNKYNEFNDSNQIIDRIVSPYNYADYYEDRIVETTKKHNNDTGMEALSFHVKTNVLNDLFVEYLFGDLYHNIKIDIETIKIFISRNPSECLELIDESNLYCNIIDLIDNSKNSDLLQVFDKFKGKDYRNGFLNLKTQLRLISSKLLVDGATQFDNNSSLYKENIYGCEVLYLDGEDFYAFVRTNAMVIKFNEQPSQEIAFRPGTSFSYIGTENIQTYKNPNHFLTFIYNGVNPENIRHVYHDDSWSNNTDSFTVNEYHSPQSILNDSKKYAEIKMQNIENIKPKALLCYDEPSEWDFEFCQKYNLPIVVINTEKYNKKYEEINSIGPQYI